MYMPVPSSKPARLLIRGTIEMYQWKCPASFSSGPSDRRTRLKAGLPSMSWVCFNCSMTAARFHCRAVVSRMCASGKSWLIWYVKQRIRHIKVYVGPLFVTLVPCRGGSAWWTCSAMAGSS